MNEQTTVEPAPLYGRVNPPSEVTTAIANTKAACQAWVPAKLNSHDHPLPVEQIGPEAGICDHLLAPPEAYPVEFKVGVGAGVIGTIIVIMVWRFLAACLQIGRNLLRRLVSAA